MRQRWELEDREGGRNEGQRESLYCRRVSLRVKWAWHTKSMILKQKKNNRTSCPSHPTQTQVQSEATFTDATVFTCIECMQHWSRWSGEMGTCQEISGTAIYLILGISISQALLLPLLMLIHCTSVHSFGEKYRKRSHNMFVSISAHLWQQSVVLPWTQQFWCVDIWFGVLTGTGAGKALQSVDVPSISWRFCRKALKIKKKSQLVDSL